MKHRGDRGGRAVSTSPRCFIANGFATINDFTVAAMNDFDGCYWEIIVGYNGTLERYCRGNYLKRKAKAEARDADE